MTTVKISALTALAGSALAAADVLAIVDTSAGSTKKIRVDELVTGLTALTPYLVVLEPFGPDEAVSVTDNAVHFNIPSEINGKNLTAVVVYVRTASSSGLPTVQVRNVTDGFDMLSTKCTVDPNELNSSTAAAPVVIDTAHDDVVTHDEISIDVDGAGTGTTGMEVHLRFA